MPKPKYKTLKQYDPKKPAHFILQIIYKDKDDPVNHRIFVTPKAAQDKMERYGGMAEVEHIFLLSGNCENLDIPPKEAILNEMGRKPFRGCVEVHRKISTVGKRQTGDGLTQISKIVENITPNLYGRA